MFMLKLLVISHTAHYRSNGTIVAWGPTVREIDYLARLFDAVDHVAPLHLQPPPKSALAYQMHNVRFLPVAACGGERFVDKVRILGCYPSYTRVILQALRQADVVHVRCPANISLLALLLLTAIRVPRLRWYKYAGNWCGYLGEPLSHKMQRWWLRKHLARGSVTVNGTWAGQADHVHSFLNPCLTDSELVRARKQAESKLISTPVRLLFVGAIVEAKGVFQTLQIMQLLNERGVRAVLDFVGDGESRALLERQVEALGLRGQVRFHGWVSRLTLGRHYAASHVMVLPSRAEGWPKVLSEGMAYGVVPLASAVSSISQYLEAFKTGHAIKVGDIKSYADGVEGYVADPDIWKTESMQGVEAAARFTYEAHVRELRPLFEMNVSGSQETERMYWKGAAPRRE